MSVIESNKLIASFMGLTLGHPELFELRWADQYFDANRNRIGKHLLYHSSYDWLMPVVEKIEGLGHDVSILKNAVGLQWCGIGKFSSNKTKATGTTKIEAIYSAVVEFIKWYNKLGRKLP